MVFYRNFISAGFQFEDIVSILDLWIAVRIFKFL